MRRDRRIQEKNRIHVRVRSGPTVEGERPDVLSVEYVCHLRVRGIEIDVPKDGQTLSERVEIRSGGGDIPHDAAVDREIEHLHPWALEVRRQLVDVRFRA